MTRRILFLFAAAAVVSTSTGCYHFRNFVSRFRCCGPCAPAFHNPGSGYGAVYPSYDSGCATCYSGPQGAHGVPMGMGMSPQMTGTEMIGYPKPLPGNGPQVDEKRGTVPMNPMSK